MRAAIQSNTRLVSHAHFVATDHFGQHPGKPSSGWDRPIADVPVNIVREPFWEKKIGPAKLVDLDPCFAKERLTPSPPLYLCYALLI